MTDTAMAERAGWTVGSLFAARVAGLPLDTVRDLRCPETTRWAADLLDREADLARRGAELSDLLHELIGANEDQAARRLLLDLRRRMFRNALPADPARVLACVRRARAEAAGPVGEWLDRRQRLEDLRAEGATTLAAEVSHTRARLWELAALPRLREGLQVASAGLDQQLVSLARTGPGALPAKKLRKIERSTLSYVYRTACKTSPFSTLTGVAPGEFAGPAGPAHPDAPGWADLDLADAWHRRIRLNVVVVARISALITLDQLRRADLAVALTPGSHQDDNRVRYVRRWVTPGDDQGTVSFDSVRDGLFFLRRTGTLDRLTGLFHSEPGLRCRDVVRWLAAETGATTGDCERYLSILLELDMLQLPELQADVHTPDPLRALRAALLRIGSRWADRLAAELAEPVALVDAYQDADLARRRDLMDRLRDRLAGIQRDLGAPEATLPQTLLYEDVRVGTGYARVPVRSWQDAFGADLPVVEDLLPAFDRNLPHRVTLHGFFLARYGRGGRCDDLLKLIEDFHDDLYDQYASYTADRRPFDEDGRYTPEENWLGLPQLGKLDEGRQALARHVREVYEDSGATAEVSLDRALLTRIGAGLRGVLDGCRPQGHLVQVAARGDGDPLLVLNQSFGGISFPFSRFTHCFDSARTRVVYRLRARARRVAPPGAVFAEVTGGPVTSNLNLHARLTDHVIVCPGESSTAPPDCQLTLDDLYLVHDPAQDRVTLRSRRLGKEVIPVYLGYLLPMALPRIPRTLLLLSPAYLARLDIWAGVPRGPAVDGVTRRPRVRVGNVVLGRRSWALRAGDLPSRVPGQTDADWFLAWRRWRARHDLPEVTFATVYSSDRGAATASPKPQYVQFDSFLSLQAFEALGAGPDDRVLIQEALPAADGVMTRLPDGRHVTEFAIETFRMPPPPREIGVGR